jgi:hypothetical protein
VKNQPENKETENKRKTKPQQGNRFAHRKSQHIPSNYSYKNDQLNGDVIVKRAENKKPEKREYKHENDGKF